MAAGAPLLVVPTLQGNDGVDDTTVSFLLAQNLSCRRRRREGEDAEAGGGGGARGAHAGAQPLSQGRRDAAQLAGSTGRQEEEEEEQEEEADQEDSVAQVQLLLMMFL